MNLTQGGDVANQASRAMLKVIDSVPLTKSFGRTCRVELWGESLWDQAAGSNLLMLLWIICAAYFVF